MTGGRRTCTSGSWACCSQVVTRRKLSRTDTGWSASPPDSRLQAISLLGMHGPASGHHETCVQSAQRPYTCENSQQPGGVQADSEQARGQLMRGACLGTDLSSWAVNAMAVWLIAVRRQQAS